MKYFLIIIYSISLLSGDISSISDNSDKDKIQKLKSELKHAETWYWLARSTHNSIDYHSYSIKHYQNINIKSYHIAQMQCLTCGMKL